MRHVISVVAVVSALSTLLSACGSDSTPSPAPPAPTPPAPSESPGVQPAAAIPQARLRVLHASANAPMVDVWLKGGTQPVLKGATYGLATDYVKVPAGSISLELRAAPSKISDPVAFAPPPFDLAADTTMTAVAAGVLGAADPAKAFRILPLADAFKKAPGKVAVRVVHASPDAPTVGIDVGDDDPAKPEIPSLARFADSGADGVLLAAGQPLQIGIVAGGSRVTAFTTPMLPDGSEVFVVAAGLLGRHPRADDGFSLIAASPIATLGFVRQNPVVYALHASPDAPAVDLYVGQAEIADNLAFGQLSASTQVRPGRYDVDFFTHAAGNVRPSGAPATTQSSGILLAGQRYLAVAAGFLAGSPSFELAAFSDEKAYDDTVNARVRAVHASPDAPTVDIGVATSAGVSPVLMPGLPFLGSSLPLGVAIAPGSYTLGVTPAGQSAQVVARFPVALTAGARSFAIAAGALDPTKGQALRLLLVDTAASPWAVASVSPL